MEQGSSSINRTQQQLQLHRDRERLAFIVRNMMLRNSSRDSKELNCILDDDASSMLLEYINEITCAVIEEAALLTKHRKAKEIDANDINFIMGKLLFLSFLVLHLNMSIVIVSVKKLGVSCSISGLHRPKLMTKHSFRLAGRPNDEDDDISSVGSSRSMKSISQESTFHSRVCAIVSLYH